MEEKILIIDIETTGFQNQGALIVEIGIVSLDLDTGQVTPEFESIVQEAEFNETHVDYPYGWVFDNSDLMYHDVLNAPYLKSVLPDVQAILDRFPLGATAYNKSFDFGFLKSRGLKIKDLPCIMLTATPIVNLPSTRGHKNPKWPTVEEAWGYFFPEIFYTEKHRGLDDAHHEALILYEIHKLGKFMDEPKPGTIKHCCKDMNDNTKVTCKNHTSPFDCPDCLIFYSEKNHEYGIIVHDGGTSYTPISTCPWCSVKLPEIRQNL